MASFYSTAEWQRARRVALIEGGWKCARCGTSLAGKGKASSITGGSCKRLPRCVPNR